MRLRRICDHVGVVHVVFGAASTCAERRRRGARWYRRGRGARRRRHSRRPHRGDRTACGTISCAHDRREALVESPGFIDVYTLSEMPLIADGTAQIKVRQGVTLDITGESTSAAP